MKMLVAFCRYWLRPSLANWRSLRRIAMSRLPAHTTRSRVHDSEDNTLKDYPSLSNKEAL